MLTEHAEELVARDGLRETVVARVHHLLLPRGGAPVSSRPSVPMSMATSTALTVAGVRAWLESLEPGAICGTSHVHQACPLATYLSQAYEGRESYVDVFFYWVRDRIGRQHHAETPGWGQRFVFAVNRAAPSRPITAQEVLALLERACPARPGPRRPAGASCAPCPWGLGDGTCPLAVARAGGPVLRTFTSSPTRNSSTVDAPGRCPGVIMH